LPPPSTGDSGDSPHGVDRVAADLGLAGLERSTLEELRAELRGEIERAWSECDGSILNTSRVNEACGIFYPGAACAHNEPNRLALFCRDETAPLSLAAGYTSPLDRGHTPLAHFHRLVNQKCLPRHLSEQHDLMRHVDQQCYSSPWWEAGPRVRGNASRLVGGAASREDEAALRFLGISEFFLNGKMLFCLCAASESYKARVAVDVSVSRILTVVTVSLFVLAVLTLVCVLPKFQDVDATYYDPDLL